MRVSKAAVLFFFCAPVFPAGIARGQQLVGYEGVSNRILDINKATGAASNFRNTGLLLADIAVSPTTGILYGVTRTTTNNARLYTIDIATGVPTLVGSLGLPSFREGDLAFSSAGVLYAVDGPGNLSTVNLATGAATSLGSPAAGAGVDDISALFFVGNALYAVDDRVNADDIGRLYTINPANGLINSTATLNVDFSTSGLAGAVDPSTGVVYIGADFVNSTGTLYTLNIATASLTTVGSSDDLILVEGLTFIPEPASLSLLALAGVSLIRQRRARRD